MKKYKYIYHVSFNTFDDKTSGTGSIEITTFNKPIEKSLDSVKSYIKNNHKKSNVIILNWKFLYRLSY